MKKVMVVLMLVFLFGCAAKKVALKTQFDEAKAERLLASGSNSIHGSALIRQNGGGIVTCAGNQVTLMPETELATEWIVSIYGSAYQGFHDALARPMQFSGKDNLFSVIKLVDCDAQGNFDFSDVADGSFFIFTRITWMVGHVIQGGSIMKRISVSNGKKENVVLSH